MVKQVKRSPSRRAAQTDDDRGQADPQPGIAQRAYELYEQRGYAHGHDREDWIEAERQILSERRS
ncbi:MAG: DUF2934 domain-containing protein [Nitrospirae bacterium]|nr:DUF2934 domain-containing protein [Nitrospirota bacterium]MBU6481017.1 DUF2934 domain-containing protein [Nitrospirota bacterium]MDE3042432.1 DUF2934 domain-containing protein [Nitrospirota bacterium]